MITSEVCLTDMLVLLVVGVLKSKSHDIMFIPSVMKIQPFSQMVWDEDQLRHTETCTHGSTQLLNSSHMSQHHTLLSSKCIIIHIIHILEEKEELYVSHMKCIHMGVYIFVFLNFYT